jgi:hypothetical protein
MHLLYTTCFVGLAQTRHHKIHFAFPCFRIFNFCISMFPHFQLLHFPVSAFSTFAFPCFRIFIFSYFHVSVFSCFRIFIYSYFVHCCNFHTIFFKKFLQFLHRLYITNYIFSSFSPSITLLNSFKVICLHVN